MGRRCTLITIAGAALALPGAAVVAPVPAAEAAATPAPPLKIGTISGFRVIAGGYDTQRPLGRAIARFGEPTTRRRTGELCDVRWRALRSRWSFYNLGGANPCSDDGGLVGTAALAGRAWQTARGVRIGAPASAIRRRHPHAFRCDAAFLIAPVNRAGSARYRLSPTERRRVVARCRARSSGRSGRWWLAPVYSIAGGSYYSRLTVRVTRGRVVAFVLDIGAGGD